MIICEPHLHLKQKGEGLINKCSQALWGRLTEGGHRKDVVNGDGGPGRQSGLKGVLEMTKILTGIHILMNLLSRGPVMRLILLQHESYYLDT